MAKASLNALTLGLAGAWAPIAAAAVNYPDLLITARPVVWEGSRG